MAVTVDHLNSDHSNPPLPVPMFYCNNSVFNHNFTVDLCWYIHINTDFYTKVFLTGLVIFVGVIGNVLLGGTILFSSRLRTKSINIFIVNLSISNILQLLIVPTIVTVDNLTEFFELGFIGCKSKMFVTNLFFIVPMLTLSVISVDRFLAIRFPFRDLKYRKVALMVCILIWVAGVGASSYVIDKQVKYLSFRLNLEIINIYSGLPALSIQRCFNQFLFIEPVF